MTEQKRVGILVNAFFSAYAATLLKEVAKYCKKNDFKLIVFPVLLIQPEMRYDYQYESVMDFIKKSNIDILLIASATIAGYASAGKIFERIQEIKDVPKISLGLKLRDVPSIICDFMRAYEEILIHIIEKHNCKNVLLFTAGDTNLESMDREKVVRRLLSKYKIKLDEKCVLNGSFSYNTTLQIMADYVKQNGSDFDSIICLNDNMAAGCMFYLSKHKNEVPQDIVIIGFDNDFEAAPERLNLTTVDQQITLQAQMLINIAISIFNGEEVSDLAVVNAVPIIRGSCGCINEDSQLNSIIEEKSEEEKRYLNMFHSHWNELALLNNFFLEIHQPVPVEQLHERLEKSFSLFDIPHALIVLYDEPVYNLYGTACKKTMNASLAIVYSEKNGISMPNVCFDPNEYLVPPEYSKAFGSKQIVFEIFGEAYQYGYMVFTLGGFENIFYQNVNELISKEIVTSINLSRTEKEKEKLLSQNNSLEGYSEKLRVLSYTDEMTKKLNRRGFYELAQKLIELCTAKNGYGVVLYCDMDGLKLINDTYGHEAGDRAIKYEAEALSAIFRSTDIIGRLGGDEFAIVAPNVKSSDFGRIKKALGAECLKINSEKNEYFSLSISMGCAEFSAKNNRLEFILNQADKELYKEKKRKKKKSTLQR